MLIVNKYLHSSRCRVGGSGWCVMVGGDVVVCGDVVMCGGVVVCGGVVCGVWW
jgi:hypothetical protein